MHQKQFISTGRASKMLDVSDTCVRNWIDSGRLRGGFRIDIKRGARLVPVDAVERLKRDLEKKRAAGSIHRRW